MNTSKPRKQGCEELSDRPHEECGVIGIYGPDVDVARMAFFGLYALQHRGQESAGIVTADGSRIRSRISMGLVHQAFREEDLEHLTGSIAIGHTRYSTTGSSLAQNAQPVFAKSPEMELALGHNGNLINAKELRAELVESGIVFKTSTDSEVIAQALAWAPGQSWKDRVGYLMRRLHGAYSLVALTKNTLLAMRDPLGIRPLCLGKFEGGWVVASESCALDHLGAELIREIEPGETLVINSDGVISIPPVTPPERRALCIFEHIYFARPDTLLDGRLVYTMRHDMGAQLAREHPAKADLVIGVPDSATAAAVGFASESNIPYSYGLMKNRYVGRTFIQPDQRLREVGVQMKFNPLPEVLKGKRIVVVDDSIVRGTTTPWVVSLLRRAGATEVHLRVCAPPIRNPCHFGVDMATRRELLATNRSVSDIREVLGADSLGYLSVEGLHKVVGASEQTHCNACFTGRYPIPIQLEMDKLALEEDLVEERGHKSEFVYWEKSRRR